MSGVWADVAVVVALLLALAWYLSYTAARLDRLHARVEGSLASLDAQLVRRAEAAAEYAQVAALDPASALLLASSAADSLQAADSALITDDVQQVGVPVERAQAETALTQTLALVVGDASATDGAASRAEAAGRRLISTVPDVPGSAPEDGDDGARQRLADACDRVELAYRFHNEAVRDVRRVRAKAIVRALHLAGRTQLPEEVTFATRVHGLGRTDAWR